MKGEPGTGKTLLAEAIAESLGPRAHPLARQVDDARAGRPLRLRHRAAPLRRALRRRRRQGHPPLHQARARSGARSRSSKRVVLLIDEVDKADLEFPNDLLHELDRMRFVITETGDEVVATQRPVVIITSNNEKELPDAFLRRCVFHFIDFPDAELMKRIVRVHHPNVDGRAGRPGGRRVLRAPRGPAAAQAPVDERARRLDRGAHAERRRARAARPGAPVPRGAPEEGARRRAPQGHAASRRFAPLTMLTYG